MEDAALPPALPTIATSAGRSTCAHATAVSALGLALPGPWPRAGGSRFKPAGGPRSRRQRGPTGGRRRSRNQGRLFIGGGSSGTVVGTGAPRIRRADVRSLTRFPEEERPGGRRRPTKRTLSRAAPKCRSRLFRRSGGRPLPGDTGLTSPVGWLVACRTPSAALVALRSSRARGTVAMGVRYCRAPRRGHSVVYVGQWLLGSFHAFFANSGSADIVDDVPGLLPRGNSPDFVPGLS
jgi:hypothetical protein